MRDVTIGFIGGGNMARSLIGGLIADGTPANRIWVSEPEAERRSAMAASFGVHTSDSNRDVVDACDVVVLAVKPQVIRPVCEEMAEPIQAKRPLVVSIAAGIRTADLDRWLGGSCPVVRTMPNTPALVQSGATALYANEAVSEEQRETAEGILRAVGLTLWLRDEALMDAVTAVSGSGPAYFFLVIELLEQAGVKLGLAPEQARLLSLQTAFGAAKMALESAEDAATLRARVTSPGGTTEKALSVLNEAGFSGIFERAVSAARDQADELARRLGEDA